MIFCGTIPCFALRAQIPHPLNFDFSKKAGGGLRFLILATVGVSNPAGP